MYFHSISQIGEIILVDNEDAINDIELEAYSNMMNWEVITETREVIGRVRGFKLNGENGKIYSIAIAFVGIVQIPDQFLSIYEISVDEIVSTGSNRVIVFEGAEKRVTQLSVGILDRLGIGRAYTSRIISKEHLKDSDEDDCGGSPPIPIPRRPSPKPSDDDLCELLLANDSKGIPLL